MLFSALVLLKGLQRLQEGRSSTDPGVRLVGGDSRCAGTLEVKHQGEWRPVWGFNSFRTLKEAKVACRDLNCGSAVSVGESRDFSETLVWMINLDCVQSGSSLRECAEPYSSVYTLNLTCSDSVRLLDGTSLCSGRLEVKSDQPNPSWSSVCEADFDLQDAEVVCRDLDCGAPLVLQGVPYGEKEAPMSTKEFQCGGHESALLDCRSSGSDRNTCSPGRAVSLTCSESVRLVGADSRCAGTLEVKHQSDWRPVDFSNSLWSLKTADAACRELNCGSAVSVGRREECSGRSVWKIRSDCVQSGSALRECAILYPSDNTLNLTCSDSVRLLDGTSLCSGRLEVKSDQSNPLWSSVCEGALYGEKEAPMSTKEFQCGGHESALLDCRSSGSERNTCSPGRAVSLTCSESVRLVGADSRCAGTLEVKHQSDWRPVDFSNSLWSLKTADAACRELNCGSAVSVGRREESSGRSVWKIRPYCVQSGTSLRECSTPINSNYFMNLTCSDLLFQPNISLSSSMDRVSEAQQQGFQMIRGSTFTISCSIQPQYPGGSFQLNFTSSSLAHNYNSKPAVNHSAHFLFPSVEHAHQGSYSCVYHDFSSESRLLSVIVTDPAPFIIRAVVLPLTLLLVTVGLYSYCKATRGRRSGRQEDIELDFYNLGVPAVEEKGVQGAK
ncbi:hypothetical protein NQZ68_030730 [Dissostichus eleginoides]|nr:hypothetical protein NQZ68_030730 [Dissostichus eleginoides]